MLETDATATKTCPRCAEDIKVAAVVCRFCGHEFGAQSPPTSPPLQSIPDHELADLEEKAQSGKPDPRLAADLPPAFGFSSRAKFIAGVAYDVGGMFAHTGLHCEDGLPIVKKIAGPYLHAFPEDPLGSDAQGPSTVLTDGERTSIRLWRVHDSARFFAVQGRSPDVIAGYLANIWGTDVMEARGIAKRAVRDAAHPDERQRVEHECRAFADMLAGLGRPAYSHPDLTGWRVATSDPKAIRAIEATVRALINKAMAETVGDAYADVELDSTALGRRQATVNARVTFPDQLIEQVFDCQLVRLGNLVISPVGPCRLIEGEEVIYTGKPLPPKQPAPKPLVPHALRPEVICQQQREWEMARAYFDHWRAESGLAASVSLSSMTTRDEFNQDGKLRWRILARDNYTCRACGATGAIAELTVDHIIPVTRGGTNDESNLQALCRPCNSRKGTR